MNIQKASVFQKPLAVTATNQCIAGYMIGWIKTVAGEEKIVFEYHTPRGKLAFFDPQEIKVTN
jgi:hypothetical protein